METDPGRDPGLRGAVGMPRKATNDKQSRSSRGKKSVVGGKPAGRQKLGSYTFGIYRTKWQCVSNAV
jgi:hypothetical protein